MPRRQRRAGYLPSRQLSPELESAIDDEAARLAAVADPVEAVREVTELFIALDDELEAVAGARLRLSRTCAGHRRRMARSGRRRACQRHG